MTAVDEYREVPAGEQMEFPLVDLGDGDLWDSYDEMAEPPAEEDPFLDPGPTQREYEEAVEQTRAELGGDGPDAQAPEWVRERFKSLDWESAFATDFTAVDWLPGRFMEKGQQVTLVGDGKVGKSLFALDWAFRMAAGRSFLGDKRHEPLRVLYVDRENSLRDVVTRAQALGANPKDLTNLVYKQFPGFTGSLDASRQAAHELLALIRGHKVDVVVLDTVSRFISGKENDSDTWLQLYQLIHAPMKAMDVACLRLDHFGKDAERGSRGSSAKSQDVDHVWELSKVNGRTESRGEVEVISTTVKLARTHTRTGLGDDLFTIGRTGERMRGGMWLPGRTHHQIVDGAVVQAAKREVDVIVDELVSKGAPRNAGRDKLQTWMRQQGMTTFSSDRMAEVVRALKERYAAE